MLSACAMLLLLATIAAAGGARPRGQAIQFGIAENFRLTDFGGATLAYQRFVCPDVAWRISVGVDAEQSTDESSYHGSGDEDVDGAADVDDWFQSFSLASEWLWYRGEAVSVFFGGGPRVSYSSVQDEYWGRYTSESWARQCRVRDVLGAGLQGCLGVQWTAAGWLTLHAEYDVQCMYSHTVTEDRFTVTGDSEQFSRETDVVDGVSLDSRGVRFGLSAYF